MLIADCYKMSQNDQFLFLCPNNCGRRYVGYSGKSNLKRHLLFECGVEPQFQCQFCQKRFSRKANLNSHLLFKHKSILKFDSCLINNIYKL